MKKSTIVRLGSLAIALTVLSAALMVTAFSGSPYETLKGALLETAVMQNGTMEGTAKIIVNGEVIENSISYMASSETASYSKYYNDDGEETGFNYNSGKLSIYNAYTAEDGTQWYSAYLREDGINYKSNSNLFGMSITKEDLDSASVRFATLAVDALVGDLKNNIVMSTENGTRYISGTLTAAQMPEIARAGIDMMAEQSTNGSSWRQNVIDVNYETGERTIEELRIFKKDKTVTVYKETFEPVEDNSEEGMQKYHNGKGEFYGTFYENEKTYAILKHDYVREYTSPVTKADYRYYGDTSGVENPLDIPMKKLDVTYVHGEATVDQNGTMTYMSVKGNATVTDIFDTVNEVEIIVELSISDVGATKIVCPIPGADKDLTKSLIRNKLGNPYNSFYFKLNDDGTVDKDSLTTKYPGEMDYRKAVPAAEEIVTLNPEMTIEITDNEDSSIGVIGGADGPTTIYIAGGDTAGDDETADNETAGDDAPEVPNIEEETLED